MRFQRLAGTVAALGAALALAVPAVASAHSQAGFVYTETNSPTGNAVLGFARIADGALAPIGSFATGGLGSGGNLATQGEVVLTGDAGWLLAVNAASNDVSLFRVHADGALSLTDRASAHGTDPVSVTVHGDVVYVLDAGGAGNIAGFRLGGSGLHYLAGSSRPLSGSATGPAEVAFSTDGRFLVVTERNTNLLDTYLVIGGIAGWPVTTISSGPVPYGFAFDLRDHPIVSEAANSTLSSYRLGIAGATVISASVPTGGIAACWVAVTPNGRIAYDSNAHGGTISSFAIHVDGSISLVQSVAADTGAGSTPLDLAASSNGRFLYVNEAGSQMLAGYRIGLGGSLTAVPGSISLPAGSSGLAAS